jgi:hypothetical protein
MELKKRASFLTIMIAIFIFSFFQTGFPQSTELQNLFIYLPHGEIPLSRHNPREVRKHKVKIRFELLESNNVDRMNINLFDNVNYEVKKEKLIYRKDDPYLPVERNDNGYTWYGKFIKYPGLTVIIVVGGDSAAGTILSPEEGTFYYEISHGGQDYNILTKVDQSKFPPD